MAPARRPFLAAALVGGCFLVSSAQALTTTQVTGAKLFTVTGPNTVSTPISFTRFRPDKVAPNQTNVVLLGYDYIITKVTESGTIGLLNTSTSTLNGPFQRQATLSFDRIDAASNEVSIH